MNISSSPDGRLCVVCFLLSLAVARVRTCATFLVLLNFVASCGWSSFAHFVQVAKIGLIAFRGKLFFGFRLSALGYLPYSEAIL